jgi:hypothetical protein
MQVVRARAETQNLRASRRAPKRQASKLEEVELVFGQKRIGKSLYGYLDMVCGPD